MKVKYNVKKWGAEWFPQFTIGVQTFSLQPVESEKHALWYVDMMKIAFNNINKPEEEEEEAKDGATN